MRDERSWCAWLVIEREEKKKPAHWRHPCIERKLNTLFFVLFFQCVAFLFQDLFRSETVFCFKWISQVERTRFSLFVVVLLVDALFILFHVFMKEKNRARAFLHDLRLSCFNNKCIQSSVSVLDGKEGNRRRVSIKWWCNSTGGILDPARFPLTNRSFLYKPTELQAQCLKTFFLLLRGDFARASDEDELLLSFCFLFFY